MDSILDWLRAFKFKLDCSEGKDRREETVNHKARLWAYKDF